MHPGYQNEYLFLYRSTFTQSDTRQPTRVFYFQVGRNGVPRDPYGVPPDALVFVSDNFVKELVGSIVNAFAEANIGLFNIRTNSRRAVQQLCSTERSAADNGGLA